MHKSKTFAKAYESFCQAHWENQSVSTQGGPTNHGPSTLP
jgi:hypothetical protein